MFSRGREMEHYWLEMGLNVRTYSAKFPSPLLHKYSVFCSISYRTLERIAAATVPVLMPFNLTS